MSWPSSSTYFSSGLAASHSLKFTRLAHSSEYFARSSGRFFSELSSASTSSNYLYSFEYNLRSRLSDIFFWGNYWAAWLYNWTARYVWGKGLLGCSTANITLLDTLALRTICGTLSLQTTGALSLTDKILLFVSLCVVVVGNVGGQELFGLKSFNLFSIRFLIFVISAMSL